MVKFRVLFFLLTLLIVGTVGYFLSFYAKGYRFDFATLKFLPNGILVIKSNPDGAQIFVNNELKTATNATINLPPATYDISIRKEGYGEWKKTLTIQKEVVTEADAHLFRVAPSLSAVTFAGVASPLPSPDFTKIAYIVPPVNGNGEETSGLWIMETVNLPLGFSRDPRRIANGDFADAEIIWSPDGREILLSTEGAAYLLDATTFTPTAERVNVILEQDEILTQWRLEEERRYAAMLSPLPDELEDVLKRRAEDVVFSPDESKLLYTVNGDETLPSEIIKPVPGASTQKEERELKNGRTYVYDLKEDRNFAVDTDAETLSIETWKTSDKTRRMFWFASSRHVVLAEDSKISIMDLDGTNKKEVYSGSYVAPNVLTAPSIDRLLVLTNLGANSTPANIYTLSLK